MSVTDEIKDRLDIVDVVSDYVPLRKSGSSHVGFCPFHPNTRTPAFVVFPNSQTWRCFGACAEGGDIFSFVMKKEGWDFKEALAQLAKRAGVELEPIRPVDQIKLAYEDKLTDLLEAVADYYHHLLLYAPQAEQVRQYVSERGLQPETLELFKIGFALDSWDACRMHFSKQGYSDDDLLDAGLLTANEEKGTRYDRFRNRLMIPIHNAAGRLVGFGARTLDPDGLPKYLNSPQTAVFDKGRLLYGLDKAKRHIREARQVVIVEGYMDVMQAWQAGFHNVVAQMGTALTGDQLALVKRYAKRFILALDADAAGAQATLRSLQVAREFLDREPDIRFDARGLVRHEGRLQADIRIVTLPPGNDPDKIIRSDPDAWPQLIAQAKPVVTYVIDQATTGLDLNDPKAKSDVAAQVLPLITDVVDPIEREHYRQLLARRLQIDERTLRKVSLPASGGPTRRADPVVRKATPSKAKETTGATGLSAIMRNRLEAAELRRTDFLRQCLARPQIILVINDQLQGSAQAAVSEEDFVRPEDQLLWYQIQERGSQYPFAAAEDLWDSFEDELIQDRVQKLLTMPESPESELDRLPDRLVQSVLDWRLERIKSLIEEVEQLVRETNAQDNPELIDMYLQQLRGLLHQVLSINKARAALSATAKRRAQESAAYRRNSARAD